MKGIQPPWKSSSTAPPERLTGLGRRGSRSAKFSSPFAAEFQAAAWLRNSVGLSGSILKTKAPEVAFPSYFLCFPLWFFFSLMCNCKFRPIASLDFGHMG